MVAVTPDVGEIAAVTVREFDGDRDLAAVERLESACEVGPSGGKMCLFTDLLGDPLCRVRHSPAYLMLVAEAAGAGIVGVVRGCVKTVSCGGQGQAQGNLMFAKVGYLLGLRVSPAHRRRGVARRLVERMEAWFRRAGAEYAYVATDAGNEPSVRLFTARCGYAKFRAPSLLVHPVFRHDLSPPSSSPSRRRRRGRGARIVELSPREAEILYRARFAGVEFFPRDIDAVLSNPLSLGTFLAIPAASPEWQGIEAFLASPPASWAVASAWDCGGVFRLELRGASRLRRGAAAATRALDRAAKWLRVPSVPDLFRPFAGWFVYGLGGGGGGGDAALAAEALFASVVNMARGRAAVVAVEVAACDPLRRRIPHWRRLSCAEDLWCMKRLGGGGDGHADGWDWSRSAPGNAIFVDPREV